MPILIFVCTILLCAMFTSCSTTPITEIPEIEEHRVTPQLEKSSLEFIGLKMDTRNLIYDQLAMAKAFSASGEFKRLGYNLEKNNFAVDKSNFYFGTYDLQELKNYKNTERFITFVEIEDNSLKYEISGKSKIVWGSLSGLGLSTGIAFLAAGSNSGSSRSEGGSEYDNVYDNAMSATSGFFTTVGVISSLIGAGFLIPALKTQKTTTTFNGTYSIYVYDTLTQSVVRRETLQFRKEAEFKGVYTANEESQDKVTEYYSKLISNEILQKYEEIIRWLNTIK